MTQSAKNVLVTGASRGLGFEIARCLAARGHRVTLVARDAKQLNAAASKLAGSAHQCIAADLSRPDQAIELSRRIEQDCFDMLINNAGGARFGALDALSAEILQTQLQLNFVTPALLSRAFVKTAQPGSMLVNVTSIVGRVPMPGNAAYSAAKAGLQVLTECLWSEVRQRGVHVLDFRPVSIKSDFHKAAGRPSVAAVGGVATDRVAADLMDAIEKGHGFVYSHGLAGSLLELAARLLPRKRLIQLVGARSRKAGYLE